MSAPTMPPLNNGTIGYNGRVITRWDNQNGPLVIYRTDGGASQTLAAYLYDTSWVKDWNGDDLIIGVSADRRSIWLYKPSNDTWENVGIYDSHADYGTLYRPTFGNQKIMFGCLANDGTPQVGLCDRGGTNIRTIASGVINPFMSFDATWCVFTGQSLWNYPDLGINGHYLQISCKNIDGSPNPQWLTHPWEGGDVNDADEASLGQWSSSYGQYVLAFQTSVQIDRSTAAWVVPDRGNATGWPKGSDVGVVRVDWQPVGDGTTWHVPISGTRCDANITPHQDGYYFGDPCPVWNSQYNAQNSGDPGWVSVKFRNPWGAGVLTLCPSVGMNYTWETLFSPLGISAAGSADRIAQGNDGNWSQLAEAMSYTPAGF